MKAFLEVSLILEGFVFYMYFCMVKYLSFHNSSSFGLRYFFNVNGKILLLGERPWWVVSLPPSHDFHNGHMDVPNGHVDFAHLMKRSASSCRWIRLFSSSSLFVVGQPCDYSTNSPRLPCVACAISSSWVSSQLALFFLSCCCSSSSALACSLAVCCELFSVWSAVC